MSKLKRMYVFDNGVQYNDKSTMLAGYNVATFRDQKKVSTYITIPIQTFLFQCDDGYVLFDTACDPEFAQHWPADMLERSPYIYPENGLLPDRLRELGLLPDDIGAMALQYAPQRFHARLNATEKTYVYRVWNSAQPDVFERRYRTQMRQRLDLAAMERAAALLLGTHDFRSFCANKQLKKSTVRTLKRLDLVRDGDELRFCLTADGFLYHMVRIIVGTLLEIGQGKRPAEDIGRILAARRREAAGETAPAKGLCLTEVRYE